VGETNGKRSFKMAKEIIKHFLPAGYDGRCQGVEGVDYVNGFCRTGLSNVDKVHVYEMRLPIPKDDEECMAMYNRTIQDLVLMGLGQLKTRRDGDFRNIVFGEIAITETDDKGNEVITGFDHEASGEVSENAHLAAQANVDDWRHSETTSKKKADSVGLASAKSVLVQNGKITQEDADAITNEAELLKALASI